MPKVYRDYKTGAPVGTFHCSCGFVYSRKGPDKNELNRYKIGKKKKFGKYWEEVLYTYLFKGTYKLRELAREMDCDPKTIIKYDLRFKTYRYTDINDVRGEDKNLQANIDNLANNADDLVEQYISEIKMAIISNPDLKKSQLRKEMKKQYSYLYRKDKQLLNEVLPNRQIVKRSKIRVNWEIRDEEVCQQLSKVYEKLILARPMVRITMGQLAKPLGMEGKLYKWIEIGKLPKTKEYINEIVESVQDYQLRRCRTVIQEMKQNNEEIKIWKLQRRVGIRKEQFNKLLVYLETDLIG